MKGQIYKIELNENNIYVGSTTAKLCKRQAEHNQSLKKFTHRKLYKSCIENNINYINCIWVADIEYDSNAELRKIEEDYRKSLNGNLNSYRCYTTEEDRKEYNKKWHKNHYENNKIEISEKRKEHRKQNKDKINEKNKEYSKEYRKQNKIKIKEKNKEKIKCDKCDCLISKSNLKRHKKSIKCVLLSECLFSDSD